MFKFVSHVLFLELDIEPWQNKWIDIEVRVDIAERNHEIYLSFFSLLSEGGERQRE